MDTYKEDQEEWKTRKAWAMGGVMFLIAVIVWSGACDPSPEQERGQERRRQEAQERLSDEFMEDLKTHSQVDNHEPTTDNGSES
jgi:hypothetical protein